MAIIIALQTTDNTDRQLAAAVCLTYLIHKLDISFHHVKIEEISIPLLKLMCLCPNMKVTPPQCPEYDRLSTQLFKKLTPEQRSGVALVLCLHIIPTTGFHTRYVFPGVVKIDSSGSVLWLIVVTECLL